MIPGRERLDHEELYRAAACEVVVFGEWLGEQGLEVVVKIFVNGEGIIGFDRVDKLFCFLRIFAAFFEVESGIL